MHTDSRSQRLLRSTLERSPVPAAPSPGRRRHSHVPRSRDDNDDNDNDDNDSLSRAAFLYRTAATAATPIRPHTQRSASSSRPPSPSHRPISPSPSSHRQSLQRSSPSDGSSLSLQRHNSTPGRSRKKPASLVEPLPLTPHEQVLRARLERVLISGRVVDDKERSRERRRGVHPDHDAPGWPWSEKDHHSSLASTPPKSSVSGSSDSSHYLYQLHHPQQHHRSRSKTDPVSPPPAPPATPRRATTTTIPISSSPYSTKSPRSQSQHPNTRSPLPSRNNSNSSSAGTTPPLTADHSPVFGQLGESLIHHQQHHHIDPDDATFLTPPPTPPLGGTYTPGSAKHSLYRTRSGEPHSPHSPYLYPHQRRETEGSRVERLDLGLGVGHPSTMAATFNARKASEHCRTMKGYISFANVEGLGMPPDGVDDHDEQEEDKDGAEERLGRGIGAIGGWARRLFVGIGSNSNSGGNAPTVA